MVKVSDLSILDDSKYNPGLREDLFSTLMTPDLTHPDDSSPDLCVSVCLGNTNTNLSLFSNRFMSPGWPYFRYPDPLAVARRSCQYNTSRQE